MTRCLFGLVALVVSVASFPARAADAVVVVLPARSTVDSAVVTLGKIAKIHGGDEKQRAKIAAIDLVERSKKETKETAITITKRQVELRLMLAGFAEGDVLVGGAESVAVVQERKTVPADETLAVARKALAAQFPNPEDLKFELAMPLVVKLPEIAADDAVNISAVPHSSNVKIGRVQMDITIKINGETKLAFPAHFEVKPLRPEPILVKALQPVAMTARVGSILVEAAGEAMQDGRMGEMIQVRNTTSKKVIRGRVTAPGKVEIDLGGTP